MQEQRSIAARMAPWLLPFVLIVSSHISRSEGDGGILSPQMAAVTGAGPTKHSTLSSKGSNDMLGSSHGTAATLGDDGKPPGSFPDKLSSLQRELLEMFKQGDRDKVHNHTSIELTSHSFHL